MNHAKMQELLARRYELDESQEDALNAHLTSCVSCRELAAAFVTQEACLAVLAASAPPPALRSAILTNVKARPEPRRAPRRRSFVPAVLVAAAVLLGLGLVAVRTWGPFGGQEHILTQAQAVRAALVHTVVASDRRLPRTVVVSARLGSYSGVDPAWIITISGPGVSVLSPADLPEGVEVRSPTILHRETAVVDGRTGAYVETYATSG